MGEAIGQGMMHLPAHRGLIQPKFWVTNSLLFYLCQSHVALPKSLRPSFFDYTAHTHTHTHFHTYTQTHTAMTHRDTHTHTHTLSHIHTDTYRNGTQRHTHTHTQKQHTHTETAHTHTHRNNTLN